MFIRIEGMRFSRFLMVLGCAVLVLGLGLAALVGTFGPSQPNVAVRVPNVVGLTEGHAETVLGKLGIATPPETPAVKSAEPVGTVVRQSPSAGALATRGSSVVSIAVSAWG